MTHFAKGSSRLLPCVGWNPANLARLDPERINREPVNQHNRHKGESVCSFQRAIRDAGGASCTSPARWLHAVRRFAVRG